MIENIYKSVKSISCKGQLFSLEEPQIMAIVNLTPDSFYAESRHLDDSELLHSIEKLILKGASILDLGAYSTRPGAEVVSFDEEWNRLGRNLSLIRSEFPSLLISIDTFRADIAKRCVESGADIINDVGGGMLDKEMFKTIAALKVPYILTYVEKYEGTNIIPAGIIGSMHKFFNKAKESLYEQGMHDIILDPGIGFGKSVEDNFTVMKHIEAMKLHNEPVLLGISRKSFIWKTLQTNPEGALNGTTALHFWAIMNGVDILRVHDVEAARECITLAKQMR